MINKLEKMPDDKYFSAEGLSQSFLKAFDKSPAYAFGEREETKSQDDGDLFHSLLIDPEKFDEKIMIVEPKGKNYRNTNEYKALVVENQDKTIRFPHEMEPFYRMQENINKLLYDCIDMKDIIAESQKEIACFSEVAGYQAKAKFDLLWNDRVIFDLKTISDMNRRKWQIRDFGYHRQADWYKTVYSHYSGILSEIPYILIFVETKFPYGAKTVELTEDYLELAAVENMQSIRRYTDWLARGADKTEIYLETHEIIGK